MTPFKLFNIWSKRKVKLVNNGENNGKTQS
ncbi:hypothetical protein HMPREF9454_00965 [Megamonas funiformis YIT 11815]|jgi:hypothetical protein|uniref:Uncharacterized protein n=1 Tax=Megamonas funiformis YIT 11815 TaxID=742816 RepID=A0ABN0EJ73_9FIRM|nr:hypothetical protein HMPREF9454_00965 [Megamonas funiformis YIT 11815]